VEAKSVKRWSLFEDFHRVDCVNITCSVFTLAPSPKLSYFTHLRLFQSFMMTWFKNSKCLTDGLSCYSPCNESEWLLVSLKFQKSQKTMQGCT